MRISDWSSDVCSSDLDRLDAKDHQFLAQKAAFASATAGDRARWRPPVGSGARDAASGEPAVPAAEDGDVDRLCELPRAHPARRLWRGGACSLVRAGDRAKHHEANDLKHPGHGTGT